MYQILEEFNVISTSVRLLLSLLCGGIIGIERGRKKRPAGFRTYMLVCVGSTLVMITNLYLMEQFPSVDPSRMGAQVVSGIGFLGAGTIIVTGRNRVKGLTTAAGLWAAASIGLAIGVGFYAGAIIGCILILFVMAALHRIDDWVMASTKVVNLYVEFIKIANVGLFMEYLKEHEMKLSDLEMSRSDGLNESTVGVLFTLRLTKRTPHAEIIHLLSQAQGVNYIQEV